MAEIERDAALAEVARVEQRRLLVEVRILFRAHRRAEADAVGPLHRFDLDHVGAHRASHAVANGPAQNAVKSSTLQPGERPVADGVAPVVVRPMLRAGHGVAAGVDRRDERAVGDAVEAERRARPDPRLARAAARTRRAPTSWSKRGSSAPLPTIVGGHPRRRRTRRRSRRRVCARRPARGATSFTSSARMNRPIIVRSSSSAAMSSRPIERARAPATARR